MLNQRRGAHDKVAAHLIPAERANDAAIITHARLLAAMMESREEANLAAEIGIEAVDSVVGALCGLRDARRMIVTAHIQLAEVKQQIGLGAVAIGGSGDKPPATAHLRSVSDAA